MSRPKIEHRGRSRDRPTEHRSAALDLAAARVPRPVAAMKPVNAINSRRLIELVSRAEITPFGTWMRAHYAPRQIRTADVRFGSKAAATIPILCVRFSPESCRESRRAARPLCAKSGLMHCSKKYRHSINSSARSSNCGGMVRPSAFAVFRLMTNSNLVGC